MNTPNQERIGWLSIMRKLNEVTNLILPSGEVIRVRVADITGFKVGSRQVKLSFNAPMSVRIIRDDARKTTKEGSTQ